MGHKGCVHSSVHLKVDRRRHNIGGCWEQNWKTIVLFCVMFVVAVFVVDCFVSETLSHSVTQGSQINLCSPRCHEAGCGLLVSAAQACTTSTSHGKSLLFERVINYFYEHTFIVQTNVFFVLCSCRHIVYFSKILNWISLCLSSSTPPFLWSSSIIIISLLLSGPIPQFSC